MSGDIVNLRQARKAKERAARAVVGAENRVRFGQSKAQRARDAVITQRETQLLDGHRLDGATERQSNEDAHDGR